VVAVVENGRRLTAISLAVKQLSLSGVPRRKAK